MRSNVHSGIAAVIVSCLTVAACGGRDARPVEAYRYGDEKMSCNRIADEVARNNSKITALYKEEAGAKDSNVAMAAVGVVLFWPALFFIDTTDTEQIEIAALMDRNDNMMSIWYDNECPGNPPEPLTIKPATREQPARTDDYDVLDPVSRERMTEAAMAEENAAAQAEAASTPAPRTYERPQAAAEPQMAAATPPRYGAAIASFMTEGVAHGTWNVYAAKYPTLAALEPQTLPTQTDEGTTLYQLVGVSEDRDAVMAACTEIRLAEEYCEIVDVEPEAAS